MPIFHSISMLLLVVSFNLLLAQKLKPEPTNDKQALKDFLARIPHSSRLQWKDSIPVCKWIGVGCNENQSFVSSLHLPGISLSGHIPSNTLSRLTDLRILSLRSNNLSGEIPSDIANLTSLRHFYIQDNQFSGGFPKFLIHLHHLVRVDISSNNFTGLIPPEIGNLTRLTGLFLQKNGFNGGIPSSVPVELMHFNVSNNKLKGEIPRSVTRFPPSSFEGNAGLCGAPLFPCQPYFLSEIKNSRYPSKSVIIGISVGGVLVLLLLLLFLSWRWLKRNRRGRKGESSKIAEPGDRRRNTSDYARASLSKDENTGTSVDGERSKLVFLTTGAYSFDLEDLLRASAEVLGKGVIGTSYKAVLEDGTTMVVKRLKDVTVTKTEFEQHMQILGNIKHENVVPLRAYYYSKEEKLLVYDFFPTGSLSFLLHGSGDAGEPPMSWSERMQAALGATRGLADLHGKSHVVHGNIKSSNLILYTDDGTHTWRLTDSGLCTLTCGLYPSKGTVEYRAPEVIETGRATPASDVYSFGVLLLELLTGKRPAPMSQSSGEPVDLPLWVRSVVREEWTAEVFDVELMRYHNENTEQLVLLLQIAMSCVELSPDRRPPLPEILQLVEAVHFGESNYHSRRSSDVQTPSTEAKTTPLIQ